jgi:phosphoribosyl-AMP cyclohydrolase
MSSEVFNLARAGWWSLVVVVIQNFRNTHVIIFAKLNKKAVHKHNQT